MWYFERPYLLLTVPSFCRFWLSHKNWSTSKKKFELFSFRLRIWPACIKTNTKDVTVKSTSFLLCDTATYDKIIFFLLVDQFLWFSQNLQKDGTVERREDLARNSVPMIKILHPNSSRYLKLTFYNQIGLWLCRFWKFTMWGLWLMLFWDMLANRSKVLSSTQTILTEIYPRNLDVVC